MLSDSTQQTLDHWQHSTRRSATWLGGQGLVLLTGTSVAGVAASAVHGAASWGSYALGSMGIGLSIGVRLFMVNDRHHEEIKHLRNFYRTEVASVLGVAPEQVGEDQLRLAGERIPSIQEALDRTDKARNAKMLSWIGGGLLAGALLFSVAIPALGGLALLEGHALAIGLAAVGVNMALFPLAKQIVQAGVSRLMHITEPTAHDRIERLTEQLELSGEQARPISQAQVFSVYLAASPAMEQQLESAVGRPYDKLDRVSQEAILKQYAEALDIDSITADLNARRIRPQELAFLANGLSSGVPKRTEPARSETEQAAQELEAQLRKGRQKATELLEEGEKKMQNLQHRTSEKFHAMRSAMHRAQARHETPSGAKDEAEDWRKKTGRREVGNAAQGWAETVASPAVAETGLPPR